MYPFVHLLQKILDQKGPKTVSGLWGASRGLFLTNLCIAKDSSIYVITPTPEDSDLLYSDLFTFSSWFPGKFQVFYLPLLEILPYEELSPFPEIVHQRMSTLHALNTSRKGIYIFPVQTLMKRLPHPDSLKKKTIHLTKGFSIDRDSLCRALVDSGYEPSELVVSRGFFSLRGGIIDIFSINEDTPVRIEFFGDQVDSIRSFDPETQRTIAFKDSTLIMPVSFESSHCALFDYLETKNVIVYDNRSSIRKNAEEYWRQIMEAYKEAFTKGRDIIPPEELYIPPEKIFTVSNAFEFIEIESLPLEGAISISINSVKDKFLEPSRAFLPVTSAVNKIKELANSYKIIIVSPTEGQAKRLLEIFIENDIYPSLVRPEDVISFLSRDLKNKKASILISYGNLSSGFTYPEASLAIITEEDIFGKRIKKRPPSRRKDRPYLSSFQDLKPGDYVVHIQHGIGKYDGLIHRSFSGSECDFLCIRYEGDDLIYVPVYKMDIVQKYIGVEGLPPRIDRLHSSRWEQTKRRVEKVIEDIANDLLDVYAAREAKEREPYSPDNYLIREFESTFEYEETPDQQSAIEEVKDDMESKKPMDRLICGDVGYGKTEVALRASCKAVMDGKQVAVLVPTTLLAQQHYMTFKNRFAPFPVKVEMLSRFRTKKEQEKIVKSISEGSIDIIIGTQRLIQKDIKFKDIGLLIVDEEQRFGVAQKEKLRQMRKIVDVLSLSATPIPRTLQMALYGIRNLSIIETPPEDRLSICTIIAPFDRMIIQNAIRREFSRGGRVFFVHNRVESITNMASFLKNIVPEARIGIAHGKMKEKKLEDVMNRFIDGKYNLLVCSSIIESGLDIPDANTIIINRADMFGLADLYQLRGRVGRSGHQAYAYLLVPEREVMTEDAKKRVKAIQEFADLGAGFKLAMKDLEIRGAGNILGKEQSGHMALVGFELYNQMLERAIKRLKGEKIEEDTNPTLNLNVSAFIPEEYIKDPSQRLSFYKRLSSIKETEELYSLEEEMKDRYGPVPHPVKELISVIKIKTIARKAMVSRIDRVKDGILFTIHNKASFNKDIVQKLLSIYSERIRFVSDFSFILLLLNTSIDFIYSEIINCLKVISCCV